MLTLNNLLRDLAATPHGDFASYDDAVLTSLTRDIFGGNSLALGIFCIQKGDPIGSSLTMRALHRCLAIQKFPLINDNRIMGIHNKFRMAIIGAQQLAKAYNGGQPTRDPAAEDRNMENATLQAKLIDEQVNLMKSEEDKQKLTQKWYDMKNKFQDVVKDKVDL